MDGNFCGGGAGGRNGEEMKGERRKGEGRKRGCGRGRGVEEGERVDRGGEGMQKERQG